MARGIAFHSNPARYWNDLDIRLHLGVGRCRSSPLQHDVEDILLD